MSIRGKRGDDDIVPVFNTDISGDIYHRFTVIITNPKIAMFWISLSALIASTEIGQFHILMFSLACAITALIIYTSEAIIFSNDKIRLVYLNGHIMFGYAFVAILILIGFFSSALYAAGYRSESVNDIKIGVWYPSDTPTTLQRLGPFEADMAIDAPIANGQFQIVLFSHGNGGNYRNHYLTAQALADSGYIIIAPNSRADFLIGGPKTAQALDYRYFTLQSALGWLQNDPYFSQYIDRSRVHGVGYSLGGASIMLASGASFSSTLVDSYCEENEDVDAEFCEDSGFIFRFIQSFRHDPTLRPTPDPFRNSALITGNAILVAPVFQGLDFSQPLSMSSLTIIAMEGDVMAKPKFHAKPLFVESKKQVPTYFNSVKGHHYGFIAPFPKWLTDEEDIPVAKDPAGFNRSVFIDDVNALIIDALKVLSP